MSNILKDGGLIRAIVGVLVLSAMADAQQAKPRSQVRVSDFPSVREYDPGYPIPYDPNNPYLALECINRQFDGVWTDIEGGSIMGIRYFSRAPMEEDYTDPNRKNHTPNIPHLTPGAAAVSMTLPNGKLMGGGNGIGANGNNEP